MENKELIIKLEKQIALLQKLYKVSENELRSANRLLDEYREKYEYLLELVDPLTDDQFTEAMI